MSSSPFWLTTERLGLRRFAPADFEWFAALQADDDVMRYGGGPKTRDEAAALFDERVLRYYDERPGLGIWLTAERATGAPVGFHLLNNIRGETLIQVGYFLSRAEWRKGYATEMAHALVRYAFLDLGLPQVVGMAALENHASQHVLEKIGLCRNGERTFAHPAYAAHGPMAWFERDRSDWIPERADAVRSGASA